MATLQFVYRLSDPNQPGNYSQSGCPIPLYLVHARPTAPQVRPWVGVLDGACAWAAGQNTDDGVARELTLGLFFSMNFVYDPSRRYWLGVGQDIFGNPVAFDHFNLSRFLQQTASHYVNGDCVDVS